MPLTKEDRIKTVMGGGGHVVILGAGTSIASTIRNPELSGKKLPSMDNFIEVVGLQDIVERIPEKLKIEILYLNEIQKSTSTSITTTKNKNNKTFEQIWEDYIIPLQGKTLTRKNGETNQIIKAEWSGIERKTSNGNNGKIKIEIFKQAVNRLLTDGSISRYYINQNYVGRASSGITLILSQVPFFKLTEKPTELTYMT